MAEKRTNPWLVLVVLVTGFFMILLDTTIVNVAIPAMSAGLNTTLDQILWVLNAYILTYAVLLIRAGRLGDLYGQRNLFAIGLAIFTAASALCGLSQDANQLIAARVLQGVGGAVLVPQTLAILTSLFPPERRGTAFGIWAGVAGLATLAGPTIGGAIVTYIDWRWIFFVNVPIGIVALIATFAIIPDLRPGRRHGWDIVGVILATSGLFGVVFGLIEGERFNWGQIASYGITIPEVIAAGAGPPAGRGPVCPVRDRGGGAGGATRAPFTVRRTKLRGGQLDRGVGCLWDDEPLPAHRDLPAVCPRLLRAYRRAHARADVAYLNGRRSHRRADGRPDRREVHPDGWSPGFRDRVRYAHVRRGARLDVGQLPRAGDCGGGRQGGGPPTQEEGS